MPAGARPFPTPFPAGHTSRKRSGKALPPRGRFRVPLLVLSATPRPASSARSPAAPAAPSRSALSSPPRLSPRRAMPPRSSRGPLPPLLLVWALAACAARASEITFELPDNAKQCFYEEIAQGTKCTLEFQVPGRGEPPRAWRRAGRAGPQLRAQAAAGELSLTSLSLGSIWGQRSAPE